MPHVALAPAQLWATRRTSPGAPAWTAAVELLDLRGGLVEVESHQFAQAIRVAVGEIEQTFHVDRGILRRARASGWPAAAGLRLA